MSVCASSKLTHAPRAACRKLGFRAPSGQARNFCAPSGFGELAIRQGPLPERQRAAGTVAAPGGPRVTQKGSGSPPLVLRLGMDLVCTDGLGPRQALMLTSNAGSALEGPPLRMRRGRPLSSPLLRSSALPGTSQWHLEFHHILENKCHLLCGHSLHILTLSLRKARPCSSKLLHVPSHFPAALASES